MALPAGKTYVPPNAASIRDDILADIRLECLALGVEDPPVQEGTDWHILATAVANASTIQLANLRIEEDNSDVLNATGDALDEIREASGLPEIRPTPSSGGILVGVTSGTATLVNGLQLVLPNGLRLEVNGTQVGIADGDSVDVVSVDTGEAVNADGGTVVRFINPPLNVKTQATVSGALPLTGGTDDEDDTRKRTRILNRRRNVVAGGAWAHLREIALNTSPALRDVFVYPALGGPASAKVVPIKRFFPDQNDFSPVATTAQLQAVRDGIFAEFPSPMEIVVQAADAESLEPTILVALPESTTVGGNGLGWVDATPWPQLDVADAGRVRITNVAGLILTLSANTATSPVIGQTIMWWAPADQAWYTRTLLNVGGSAGAWTVLLDSALLDSNGNPPAVDDYVSPGVTQHEAYAATWRELAEGFGPHENTADAFRLPRALRHPYAVDESPAQLTTRQLSAIQTAHPEIANITWGHTTTLVVPATVDLAPECFAPQHFGIYPL